MTGKSGTGAPRSAIWLGRETDAPGLSAHVLSEYRPTVGDRKSRPCHSPRSLSTTPQCPRLRLPPSPRGIGTLAPRARPRLAEPGLWCIWQDSACQPRCHSAGLAVGAVPLWLGALMSCCGGLQAPARRAQVQRGRCEHTHAQVIMHPSLKALQSRYAVWLHWTGLVLS